MSKNDPTASAIIDSEITNAKLRTELATFKRIVDDAMIPCDKCGGCGFSKPGSGYDAVCDDCSGGYTGYATGDEIERLRADLATAQRTVTAQAAQLEQAVCILRALDGYKVALPDEAYDLMDANPAPVRDDISERLQSAVDKHSAEIAEIE